MLAAARRTHHRVNPAGNPGVARYWGAAQRRTVRHDRPATEEPGMSAIVTWTGRHRLVAFFGLTFLLSWWSWPFYALGLAPTAFFPCGPLDAALAVIGVTEGRAGYRDLGARMIRWRVGWTWWLVAVGTPLAVLAVAAVANVAIWGAPAPVLATIAWSQVALGAAVRFVNPLDGPLGEEPGWRGYAVPRLQAQHSPLVSGVVLGVLVALWHLPLVASGMLAPVGLPITFAITLVYVWLFNRTGGSVLMTMVFHIAQGTVGYAVLGFTGSDAARMDWLVGVLWSALALAVVLLDRRAWQVAPAATAAQRWVKPAAR
jgi:membrane protease YdiL (CAAX protease family)